MGSYYQKLRTQLPPFMMKLTIILSAYVVFAQPTLSLNSNCRSLDIGFSLQISCKTRSNGMELIGMLLADD